MSPNAGQYRICECFCSDTRVGLAYAMRTRLSRSGPQERYSYAIVAGASRSRSQRKDPASHSRRRGSIQTRWRLSLCMARCNGMRSKTGRLAFFHFEPRLAQLSQQSRGARSLLPTFPIQETIEHDFSEVPKQGAADVSAAGGIHGSPPGRQGSARNLSFGDLLIRYRGERFVLHPGSDTLHLLAYLLNHRDKPSSRRQIAVDLWPDRRDLLRHVHEAMACYRGDFAPTLDGDWAMTGRGQFQQAFVSLLEVSIAALQDAHRPRDAVPCGHVARHAPRPFE